jgi:hypothetical protein
MDQAIQQKSLWKDSTSPVKRVSLDNQDDAYLTVHLASGSCWSMREREERKVAAKVWLSLGFKVKPLQI